MTQKMDLVIKDLECYELAPINWLSNYYLGRIGEIGGWDDEILCAMMLLLDLHPEHLKEIHALAKESDAPLKQRFAKMLEVWMDGRRHFEDLP